MIFDIDRSFLGKEITLYKYVLYSKLLRFVFKLSSKLFGYSFILIKELFVFVSLYDFYGRDKTKVFTKLGSRDSILEDPS